MVKDTLHIGVSIGSCTETERLPLKEISPTSKRKSRAKSIGIRTNMRKKDRNIEQESSSPLVLIDEKIIGHYDSETIQNKLLKLSFYETENKNENENREVNKLVSFKKNKNIINDKSTEYIETIKPNPNQEEFCFECTRQEVSEQMQEMKGVIHLATKSQHQALIMKDKSKSMNFKDKNFQSRKELNSEFSVIKNNRYDKSLEISCQKTLTCTVEHNELTKNNATNNDELEGLNVPLDLNGEYQNEIKSYHRPPPTFSFSDIIDEEDEEDKKEDKKEICLSEKYNTNDWNDHHRKTVKNPKYCIDKVERKTQENGKLLLSSNGKKDLISELILDLETELNMPSPSKSSISENLFDSNKSDNDLKETIQHSSHEDKLVILESKPIMDTLNAEIPPNSVYSRSKFPYSSDFSISPQLAGLSSAISNNSSVLSTTSSSSSYYYISSDSEEPFSLDSPMLTMKNSIDNDENMIDQSLQRKNTLGLGCKENKSPVQIMGKNDIVEFDSPNSLSVSSTSSQSQDALPDTSFTSSPNSEKCLLPIEEYEKSYKDKSNYNRTTKDLLSQNNISSTCGVDEKKIYKSLLQNVLRKDRWTFEEVENSTEISTSNQLEKEKEINSRIRAVEKTSLLPNIHVDAKKSEFRQVPFVVDITPGELPFFQENSVQISSSISPASSHFPLPIPHSSSHRSIWSKLKMVGVVGQSISTQIVLQLKVPPCTLSSLSQNGSRSEDFAQTMLPNASLSNVLHEDELEEHFLEKSSHSLKSSATNVSSHSIISQLTHTSSSYSVLSRQHPLYMPLANSNASFFQEGASWNLHSSIGEDENSHILKGLLVKLSTSETCDFLVTPPFIYLPNRKSAGAQTNNSIIHNSTRETKIKEEIDHICSSITISFPAEASKRLGDGVHTGLLYIEYSGIQAKVILSCEIIPSTPKEFTKDICQETQKISSATIRKESQEKSKDQMTAKIKTDSKSIYNDQGKDQIGGKHQVNGGKTLQSSISTKVSMLSANDDTRLPDNRGRHVTLVEDTKSNDNRMFYEIFDKQPKSSRKVKNPKNFVHFDEIVIMTRGTEKDDDSLVNSSVSSAIFPKFPIETINGISFCSFGQVPLNKMSIIKLRLCNRNKTEAALIYFEDIHLTHFNGLQPFHEGHDKEFDTKPFIILNKKLKLAPLSFVYLPLRFIPRQGGEYKGLLRGKVCFRNSNLSNESFTLNVEGEGC